MGLLTGEAVPGQTVNVSSSTETALPDWYTNYAQGILANQNAIGANPLSLFPGPRVADFTPLQQQAFGQTQAASTAYQPALQAATAGTAAVDPSAGLSAAQPYLQQAGQTTPGVINQYMNPYINDVVSQIGQQGARTLQEQILPGIRDKFIAGGTYGGSRNAEAFGNSVRDAMAEISKQQSQALASGYGQAQTAAQTDLSRFGGLGTAAANINNAAGQQQLGQAAQMAALSAQTQNLGLTGAGALQTAGTQQQNLDQQNLTTAYQDFLTQQQYPQLQQQNAIAALTGVAPAVPKASIMTGVQPTGVATTMTPSGVATIGTTLADYAAFAKLFAPPPTAATK